MNGNAYHQAFELTRLDPAVPAILEPDGRQVSYAELFEGATRLASQLAARGVAPGDRVLLMVPMSIALYQAIMGTMKCGAVCLFIDPADGIAQLNATAARLSPKAFIAAPRALPLRRVCPALARIPVLLSAEALDGGGDPAFATVPRALDDAAMISFTSGSSGTQKGVRRTHGALREQFRMISQHEGKRLLGVNFCAFPVLPLDDLSAGRTSLLAAAEPGKLALADPFVHLEQVRAHPPALLSVPPATLENLLLAAKARGVKLDTVRHAFTGGGAVSAACVRLAREVMPQAEVNVVYGSTEAEPVAMITGSEILNETADRTASGEGYCLGELAPDVQVAIVKPVQGPLERLEPADEGEILVAGPHVNRDYYENIEETRLHKFHDPATGIHWHRMGDLGWRDARGRLWLTGRLAHRVVAGDAVLDTGRIEPQVAAVSGVRRAALIGVPTVRDRTARITPAVLYELEPGVDRMPVNRAIHMLLEERKLPIPCIMDVPRIPLDRRIGAKIQYDQLRKSYGPLIRQDYSDPFGERFTEYLAERFPPKVSYVAALVVTIGVGSVAVDPWWGSLLRLAAVSVVVALFFFHLRAYDEAKDEADDRVAHPRRVISRGIVTVDEVATMDRHGIRAQALLVLILGWRAAFWWLIAMGWARLMRNEFYIGEWLRPRVIPYGLTHAPVMFWLALMIGAGLGAPGATEALAGAGLLASGLAFVQELARKLDPADTDPSALIGVERVPRVIAVSLLVLGLLTVALGPRTLSFDGGALFLTLACLPSIWRYRKEPTTKNAKIVHGTTLLIALVYYGMLAGRPWWGR